MTERMNRWNERQAALGALLRAHGAEQHEFRVDLGEGRFWWQDEAGVPSVVAETKVLGSWALSNGSVLAGWANRSLPPGAVTAVVAGVPERDLIDDELDVWDWALAIAEGAGADFVYRAPNPQNWIFLGLWNVRTAAKDEARFLPGSPWAHVRAVLGELSAPRDDGERRTLMRNYGLSFVDHAATRGTRWEKPLRVIGEELISLASAPAVQVAAGLKSLAAKIPES